MSDVLIDLIRKSLSPVSPIPTGEVPRLIPLQDIRIVIFDLYGTLFVSAADSLQTPKTDLLQETLAAHDLELDIENHSLGLAFQSLIQKEHSQLADQGVLFPEIDIRSIWREFLREKPKLLPSEIERLATDYECRANPVWPMPGLAQTLEGLKAKGIRLGIVSNAQFMTPLLFPALTGSTLLEWDFDPSLCRWSYLEGEAKPSPILFQKLLSHITSLGYVPRNCLMVGNDTTKDMAPAHRLGLRTALFAGDARSLRKKQADLETHPPDLVLTHLTQLLACL